ncbi:type III pantothenate kinase [Rhodohalobacter halophilus]|uniref:type III pantothenate kinase n=1 Tax=Rhodohalobacter halophilus TaxID=1812810 RepID=UPI00083FC662|nr:type III pantothenate kinase [Rhodohalobacter halophilus]
MSVLFLDIGNSHIKLAEKRGVAWKVLYRTTNGNVEQLQKIVAEQGGAEFIVISSVREDVLTRALKSLVEFDIKVLTTSLVDPDNLDYETPDTLGMDRFLTCYGAVSATNKDVICVDAGTACTVDWMTAEGVYRGGVIMPGLTLFHKSIEAYLPELPAVEYNIPDQWPGRSTVKSLEWGTSGSFLMAIDGFIRKYLDGIAGETELFITGGDSLYLSQNLNTELKPVHRPYLHFDGMEKFWEDLENLK